MMQLSKAGRIAIGLCVGGLLLAAGQRAVARPDFNPIGWYRIRQTWGALQLAGGIKVGQPYRKENGTVYLPVIFDLSGLETITVPPKAMNSGMIAEEIETRVKNREIHVSVLASLAHGHKGPGGWDARLGKIDPGEYTVIYDSADGKQVSMQQVDVP